MRMFRVFDKYDDGRIYYWTGCRWSIYPANAKSLYEAEAAQLASDEHCDYEEIVVTTPMRREVVIVFILIQDNKVLSRGITPAALNVTKLDAYAGFKIAIGRIKETDEREIAGVIADVGPLSGAKTWRISSDVDGLYRLVGAGGCPAELVTNRLGVLFGAGKFSDLSDLPMCVVLTAFGPTTPLAVENVAEAIVPGQAPSAERGRGVAQSEE